MTKILTGSGCGSLSMARGIRGRTVWGPLEKQIQAVSIPRQLVKLEFGPQGGRPSRALDMCNRSFPDPLGIVLWFDKLEFSGFAELTIDN